MFKEYRPGEARLARVKKDLGKSVGRVLRDLSFEKDSLPAIGSIVEAASTLDVPAVPARRRNRVTSADYGKVIELVGDTNSELVAPGEKDVSTYLTERKAIVLEDELDDLDGVNDGVVMRTARAITESSFKTKVYGISALISAESTVSLAIDRNPLVYLAGGMIVYSAYKAAKYETPHRIRLMQSKDEIRASLLREQSSLSHRDEK